MQLSSTNQKSPLFEKALRWLLIGGVGFGLMKLINFITPFILQTVGNLIALGLVGLLLGLFIINYRALRLWYFGLCKKITRFIVDMDPLSIMDGYLITLRKKYKNLANTLLFLNGKKVELGRLIDEKRNDYDKYTKLALAAKQQNELSTANLNATKALSCQKTIELYTPIYNKYIKNTDFLSELQKNWSNAIETLNFTITAKRDEFETLKEMFKGLKSVEDLISSESPEAQLYAESLKALEADVSQKISYIEDFEKRAKPVLTDMRVQKQSEQNEAMNLLEELSKNNNLKLPDYNTFKPIFHDSNIQNLDYEEVKTRYKL